MVLDFVYTPPDCGSGEPDNRPDIVSKVNFLHFATLLAVIATIVMVLISLCTEPRPERKLRRVTFWTRHDPSEPDLDSEDDEMFEKEEERKEGDEDSTSDEPIEQTGGFVDAIKRYCYNWVCGTTTRSKQKLTTEELRVIRAKLTSIEQPRFWRYMLNAGAIAVTTITVFLVGMFY